MHIGSFDTEKKIYIIAEIGNNHEGDIKVAKEMIKAASETGVNAVKFQTFLPEDYVTTGNQDRLDKLKKFQLNYEEFFELSLEAKKYKLDFFSTPFDIKSAKYLNNIQNVFKISSGDNNFFPLIKEVESFKKPTFVSMGMANLNLMKKIYSIWDDNESVCNLAFFHCVSQYPTAPEHAKINFISHIKRLFPNITVGYSDHTLGIECAKLAVAVGARIIEKHFTLDKNYSDFRDHYISSDPKEMKLLVRSIADVSKIMGDIKLEEVCKENIEIQELRRSIAANKNIDAGKIISIDDLTWVRPGSGLSPGNENELIGKTLRNSISKGEIFIPKKHI